MNYWEKRRAKDMYVAMESAEDAAREIADIYAKASRELNYQITKIYERYRDKYHLKDEEAEKLLNVIKDATDINELKRGLQDLKGAEAKELLKEVESPAYRARIERLQNLQQEIDRKMRDVYQQEKQVHTTHYVNQYNNAYYREIYDLKKRTGMDFSYSYVDEKELNRILSADWSGQNYSKRIWGNTQGLARELKEQMALAYLTGKAESDIACELTKKYATAAANARRLVRTESAYMSGQAQAAADRDAGIDKYRILATLDLRTSDKCREMDGKVFAYDDMEVGVNYPPFHPYCRTTVLSVLDDEDLSALKRRSRDPVTGEVKTFKGDVTYRQWYEKEVAGNQKAQVAEKAVKNRGADLKQYKLYKAQLGKREAGNTFADFQEMKYNKLEKWEDLKGFAKYMRKYPDSGRSYYNILRDLKEEGIQQGVSLPAKPKRAYILPEGKKDPNHIMKRMLERNITDDDIRSYVDNAKVMFSQWGGQRQMFITEDGVAVLTKSGEDWIFKTAWSKADFDEETLKILEVMSRYGK